MHALLALTPVLGLSLPVSGCGGPDSANAARGEPVPERPEVPGLDLLQPGQARRIAAAEGIGHLSDLPTYRLDLSLSDVEGRYRGSGTLRWTNTTGRAQPRLPLLLHPNAPAEAGMAGAGTLDLRELSCIEGPSCTWSGGSATTAEVVLSEPLAPGAAITVEYTFGGRLRRLSSSANDVFAQSLGSMGQLAAPVGVADYGLLGQGDGLLTAASAYPMLAPFVDGEPVVQAPGAVGDLAWNRLAAFDVRIVTPAGLDVVTNLRDAPTEPLSAGAQLTRARGAGVRDFVVVASRDWSHREITVDNTVLRSWYLSQDAEAGAAALEAARTAFRTFEDLLGPYPYRELDVAEASLVGGAGGVEFSSMVLVAGFLYRDPARSGSTLGALAQTFGALGGGGAPPELTDLLASQRRFVVAHELAHQWVPGLVGTDSRADPVIDEPLAQYLAGRVAQRARGQVAGTEERDRNVKLNYALYRLMGGPDGPARRPTHTFGGTLEYAALVYGKAPYLYVDLERRHGRNAVDRALRHAVETHAWGLVDTDAWLAALEAGGLRDAGARAAHWWEQAHGDEDLDIDDSGTTALHLMFGEEMATLVEQSLAMTGLTFGQLVRAMAGGQAPSAPYQPASPSPEEMLRMLEGEGR